MSSCFANAKAHKPPQFDTVDAMLREPLEERRKFAGHLRAISDEIVDVDPMRSMAFADVARLLIGGYG